MSDEAALPEILAEIAKIAGLPAALQIAYARGGTVAYIPHPNRLSADHWLVQAVGIEAAKAIAAQLGSGSIEIPLGPAGNRRRTWAAIRQAIKEGRSSAEIARLTGVHVRTVWRHRNSDDRQGELF